SQDRQGARPHRAALDPRPRRRGHRVNASRLAPSHSFSAYATAFTHRRRAPAPLMGAGRGGGDYCQRFPWVAITLSLTAFIRHRCAVRRPSPPPNPSPIEGEGFYTLLALSPTR